MQQPTDFEQARLQLARLHADAKRRLSDSWLELAELVCAALRIDRIGIWVLSEDDTEIRCRYLLQRSAGQVFQGAVLHAQDFPNYVAALRERRTIAVDDALSSPVTRELRKAYLEPLGITSMMDAPIYVNGRIVGVVCHEHVGPMRQWSEAECAFAGAVADNAARLYLEYQRQHAVTALHQYQHDLMELRRMEAVGRVAAEIAHDFRSILGAAMGFAELIHTTPGLTPQVSGYAQRIVDALQRGLKLTENVMSLGTHETGSPRVLDVCETIDALAPMLQVLMGESIKMELIYERPVSRIFMDSSQLERALLNLTMNARDAMPDGGVLTISVAESSPQTPTGEANAAGTADVVIKVADTGIGMDAATRAKALTPFYTTKGSKGSGLGLAIVNQIVARAGGAIQIDSEPGRGTTMRISLPRIGLPQD